MSSFEIFALCLLLVANVELALIIARLGHTPKS